MESVHGYYDGRCVHLTEPVQARPDTHVIVTFLQGGKPRFYPNITLDEVAGCLPWSGPPKSVEEMEEGIRKGASEQMP